MPLDQPASAVELARKMVHSYKQLPLLVYQIQPAWKNDLRPRHGWMDLRQHTGLDCFCFDRDEAGLKLRAEKMNFLFSSLYHPLNLPLIRVISSAGLTNAMEAEEYIYLHPAGEATLLLCDGCGYRANQKAAKFLKTKGLSEEAKPVEKVATPGVKTIDDLCAFLNIRPEQTAKAVFMTATLPNGENREEQFVFAVVRGDMGVNENKLAGVLGAIALRPAREDEIRAVGAVPGYASPVGLDKVWVVVDEAIPSSSNLVSGANLDGFHLLNVNYGRDYSAARVADITTAGNGAGCPVCGTPMHEVAGVVVGTLCKTGIAGGQTNPVTYLAEDGENHPLWTGSFHIVFEKLLACVAEANHDQFGLVWPVNTAPFQVHLVGLNGAEELSESIYEELLQNGLEVLFDDRLDSAGVKFNNADLIGIPIRVTVGKRAMKENAVEIKYRKDSENTLVPLNEVPVRVKSMLAGLEKSV